MEGILKNVPQFQSPEEELQFLRSTVQQQETLLKERGVAMPREEIANTVVREYRTLEASRVIPSTDRMDQAESEKFVLRLRPESHDTVMEEVLTILLSKGIKQAMELVAQFNSPHLDDDFHRFLVQYLKGAHEVVGLAPKSTLAKALNMTLFEVTLPEKEKSDTRGFKELLASMEQFFSGMQAVGDGRDNYGKNYFTLEIAQSNDSPQVIFYASIPQDKAELFEKQLLSIHPQAKITEITDDYNVFTENGAVAGSVAKFVTHEVFPLRTYEQFEYDSMNIFLNTFSKLAEHGEGVAIQFLIRPEGGETMKRFMKVLEKVKKGESIKEASKMFSEFDREFGTAIKGLIFGIKEKKEDEKEKTVDDFAITNITEKIKSTIQGVSIRIITSAATEERAKQILHDVESAFRQFDNPHGNSLEFVPKKGKELSGLLHNFSYRLFDDAHSISCNLKELVTLIHFPSGISTSPQLKEAKAGAAAAPIDMKQEGILLGYNDYRGNHTPVYMAREDRMRHLYVIGQTGTGKSKLLTNMIEQDIKNGDGCCFIDPHGTDIQDILSYIPPERMDDVIYFDPSYTARPMGLNMMEFDPRYPEQKSIVIDTLMGIFNQLFDMKVGGGAMFEQYFKNSALLVMEHPESGNTLLEIGRVLSDKAYRDMKLSHCQNPIIKQFWISAEQTTGDQGLANFVPYITSKFDGFISNEFMRPVVLQEKSVFNFREIMDNKKILLVNLSKGRLGELNANLIGMIIVGKIQMAALSRVDMYGKKMNDFYLYIDEFQNVTTPAIASILSEARKYRLSLNMAHQYISQLPEDIKGAVFGNVGSMAVFRISPDDAQYLESKFAPTFTASDITKLDNRNAYMSMIINGAPSLRPFNIRTADLPKGNMQAVEKLKELSYLTYGRDRAEVEAEIFAKFTKS